MLWTVCFYLAMLWQRESQPHCAEYDQSFSRSVQVSMLLSHAGHSPTVPRASIARHCPLLLSSSEVLNPSEECSIIGLRSVRIVSMATQNYCVGTTHQLETIIAPEISVAELDTSTKAAHRLGKYFSSIAFIAACPHVQKLAQLSMDLETSSANVVGDCGLQSYTHSMRLVPPAVPPPGNTRPERTGLGLSINLQARTMPRYPLGKRLVIQLEHRSRR